MAISLGGAPTMHAVDLRGHHPMAKAGARGGRERGYRLTKRQVPELMRDLFGLQIIEASVRPLRRVGA